LDHSVDAANYRLQRLLLIKYIIYLFILPKQYIAGTNAEKTVFDQKFDFTIRPGDLDFVYNMTDI